MRKEYSVHILRCSDGSYYSGMTNDIARRLEEHAMGINEGAYSHDRRPVELVHCESLHNVWDAIHCENIVKAWSWKKKHALVRDDRESLRLFAKKRFPQRTKRKYASMRVRAYEATRFLVRSRLRRELLGMTKEERASLDTFSAPR